MTQFPDERGAELRELFFESAHELLQGMNDEALKLEKLPGDEETVRSIRRFVHTLKGDAAAVGFHELSELAHKIEDALALGAAAAHASLAEIVFTAADTFAAMLDAYRSEGKLPATAALEKMVRALTQAPKARKARAKKAAILAWTEYENLAARAAAEKGKHVYHVHIQIDPHCAMPIAARQLVLKALGETGEVLGSRPEAASTETSKQFDVLVASDKATGQLETKCRIPTVVSQVKVETIGFEEPVAEEKAAGPESAPETTLAARDVPAESAKVQGEATVVTAQREDAPAEKTAVAPPPAENILRVEADRIDTVLNLVGELIIGKSMMQQALNEFAHRYPRDAARGRFADAMAFQSRVLSDLQRSVMKVRMVPVEQLFRRFPRMVRDVAKQCGKEVNLVVRGQETDLDKSLLDAIAEPLTHLVRNAISHGIETVEERTRSAKPAQGTLRLEAYHQANQVIVEITDDGRGIDARKVKGRAVERGLMSAEEAGRLSESDIFGLIFRPGFSTADEITEISGRGVGLDIVQSVLQRLKGTVQVESRPGQGTTFRLRLPLTLAIIKALLFRVEQRLYAIPLNSVAEIARASEADIHQVDNREVLQLRNQVVPVIRLGNRPAARADARPAKIFVLVISMGDRKFGLLVNSIDGEEELVIKALDDQTVETDLVSGASILGDGRVVLILNLLAIVDRFAKARPDTGASASGMLVPHGERLAAAAAAPEVRS